MDSKQTGAPGAAALGLDWQARLAGGISQGLTSASAALLAYLPARALGLQEGSWGETTAIAVVQTEFGATRSSARDQFAGAAVGGLVGAAVVSWTGQSLAGYALAVVVSMSVCWLLKIPTAARLAGITSTIIALVPHQGTIERMMLSRVMEVGWGVTIALGVVWMVNRGMRRARTARAG